MDRAISVRIDHDTYALLQERARLDDRTVAALVRRAVRQYLASGVDDDG